MKTRLIYLTVLILIVIFGSCKKFLAEKPKQTLYVPSSFEDLQALLDNSNEMNNQVYGTSLCEGAADDYYVTAAAWQSFEIDQQQNYIWAPEAESYGSDNWKNPYTRVIYNSNVVLEEIPKIKQKENNPEVEHNIEGSALLFRALAFYQLAQMYCKPYTSTAATDPGIVLRTTAAVETKSVRASVEETYTKILSDLKRSLDLLLENSVYVTRPTKAAAFALLARVYLSMRDYDNALKCAELGLGLRNQLLDFNTLALNSSQILPRINNNPEVILFNTVSSSVGLTRSSVAKIDSNLYRSYRFDDIRKQVFFVENQGSNAGTYGFRGSYYASIRDIVFIGPSTSELYLIKSECLARNGNVEAAMATLNILLKKRYNKNTFVDFSAANAAEAKSIILAERRKELIYRGQRWSDLRRFNLEGANITLKRVLNGQTYTLPPNDPRWVMLIPNEEITRSGIPQNLR